LTPGGDLGFCENIASSLGADRIVHKNIPLGSGETITELHRCGSSLFLAATSQSRLFSIRFIASGGSLQAQVAPFTQSKGLFGRIFGTSSQLGSTSGIVAMASVQSSDNSGGAFDVYAMGQSILQKWSIVEGGGERLLVEEDLKQRLLDQMTMDFVVESFALIDVAVTRSGTAAVLFCHARVADGPLRYQIAFVDTNASSPSFTILSICSLDYIRVSTSYSSIH
jgi:nuclear pore complex protein Nup133